MNREKIIELRSIGEAHLYIGMIKVDKKVSAEEKASAFFCSSKAKSLVDLLNLDEPIKQSIVNNIKKILEEAKYKNWNEDQHLEYAINLFQQCHELGDHSINLIIEKHFSGLAQVAEIDNYLYIESKFLNKLKNKLKKL